MSGLVCNVYVHSVINIKKRNAKLMQTGKTAVERYTLERMRTPVRQDFHTGYSMFSL